MDILGVVNAVTSTWNLIDKTISTRDNLKLQELKAQMYGQLADLNYKAAILARDRVALELEKGELCKQINEMHEAAKRKKKYELHESYPGTLVYRRKSQKSGDQPTEYVCPNCLDTRATVSRLQMKGREKTKKVCLACNSTYVFADPIRPVAQNREYDPYRD